MQVDFIQRYGIRNELKRLSKQLHQMLQQSSIPFASKC